MRLLKVGSGGELSLTKDMIEDIPSYAILSHTWGTDDDEVTFNDLKDGHGRNKTGHAKIQFCGKQARKDGLQYFWVDTCCIDKANHTELGEAIVSMFQWYRAAAKCYVYLSDVLVGSGGNRTERTDRTWESAFRKSRWFTRGWTLQELLAPKSVEFFSREGEWLGDRTTLEWVIHETTDIPLVALRGVPLSNFSVEEKMRWVSKRKTKRKEDMAYCLLGIFNVFMHPIYGEGENAFSRLKDEIDKSSGRKKELDKLTSAEGAGSIWHVPFDRMAGFVGRTHELQRLKREIFESNSRRIVSILGLGGVGKSRLALELAYEIKSEHPQHSVFWIHAVEQLTFEKDVLEIGKILRIPGIEEDKADIKNLFRQALSSPSTGKWLLILDNADDEALWGNQSNSNPKASPLAKYLPSTANGSIIITTRVRAVANYIAGKEVIELGEMSPSEGIEMLTKALEKPDSAVDHDASLTLLEKLAYLPLAISQAASFINMTQRTVQTYIELLDQSEEEVIKLLSKDFGDPSRYPNAKNPVATTWLISFYHILNHHQLAATVLWCMACFHEKNIPRSLLLGIDSEMDFIDAIAVLTGYSFVRRQTGSSSWTELYDLHRLVQLAARSWLKMEGLLTELTKALVVRLAMSFPTGDYRHKAIWTVYLPHAERLCEDSGVKDLPERYQLLEKMGQCFVADGKYDEAVKAHAAVVQWRDRKLGSLEEQTLVAYSNLGEALRCKGDFPTAEMYLEKAIKGQKETLGAEHPETLSSMAHLALTYMNQGRWKEAEELQAKEVNIYSRVLGAEHPETLTSMANLAYTYRNQGRWKEAEELEVQVMETKKRVRGAEHPLTLASMANLALTYKDQGRWKEAEELEVQVIETSSRVLGAEHPSTLTDMANLASTYMYQGRWKEAEELGAQVIEMSSKVLGAGHHSTLTSMDNLASTFWNQGRWKEAEELFVQVIETRKRVLGPEHPDMLTSMGNLALTYKNQGRWKEAEELQTKELNIRSRVLGTEHPSTLTSMANLASTFRRKGRWKEAEELEVQVTEARKRVLGAEHPDTLTSMANLASTFENQGWWKEAEELKAQVVEACSRVLGPEHPDTLTSMGNLASTYGNQGRWKEAEKLEVQVMETRKKVLGPEHPSTLTTMGNLASTYRNQGRWKEAEELQAKELNICSRVLGAEHPSTLTSMANLALAFWSQGRWKEAEELEVQVVGTSSRVLGADHPDTLTFIANLASMYRDQDLWKEAEDLEVQVIETRKRVLGPEHPSTLTTMNNLASTYRNQGRRKEAEDLGLQVMEACLRVLGPEYPLTLTSMTNLASTYRDQGRWKEAEVLEVQVMETRNRVLGAEHPDTLTSMANLAYTLKDQNKDDGAIELMTSCLELSKKVLGPSHHHTQNVLETLVAWSRYEGGQSAHRMPGAWVE